MDGTAESAENPEKPRNYGSLGDERPQDWRFLGGLRGPGGLGGLGGFPTKTPGVRFELGWPRG